MACCGSPEKMLRILNPLFVIDDDVHSIYDDSTNCTA